MSFIVNALNEIDQNFIKCVGCLNSTDSLTKNDAVHLQKYLEEAIKAKTGITKDFTTIILSSVKQPRIEEFKPIIYEESKGSNSDNELELDLLKDDLMCIVCHEMDVGARNRLLECSDCHALYHQECHRPVVTAEDSFETWVCQKCKDANKKAKLSEVVTNGDTSTPDIPISSPDIAAGSSSFSKSSPKPLPTTSSHRHSSSSVSSSSYKVPPTSSSKSSDKYSKSSSSSSKTSSSTSQKPSSSSISQPRATVTPNINIISADKRLQIMKKKAAKLQEKRKQLPR